MARYTPELRQAIRDLKRLLPRGIRVEWDVRAKLHGDIWGYCWQKSASVWKIQLADKGTPSELVATAVHEFAHVLVGDQYEKEGDHGPLWGVRYAECYRAVYES